jgi:UMF1 family MFS transporter
MPSALARLGLATREQRAWAMYDWANSAFLTIVVTAVFPIYYRSVAAQELTATEATGRFGLATTLALVIAAIIAPPLGAIADRTGGRLKLLARFLGLGVLATAGLALVGPGDWPWALGLFVLANIGAAGASVFYDALLPHVAQTKEMDRVSSAGYALGYVGGGLMLALALGLILKGPAIGLGGTVPTRLSFFLVAVWWAAFSLPMFRHVSEQAPTGAPVPLGGFIGESFRQAGRTLRDLRGYPQAFLMLLAFLLYNDGIQTIIRMATIYGDELKLDRTLMISAIVLVQFVGIPFAFLFGALADRFGTKPTIFLGIAGYVAITFLGWRMTTGTEFLILAALVGTVQGGTQALSRSLFARMIPAAKSGEFFGFFAIFEKFAGIFGPLLFSVAVYATGSSRTAILSTLVFFVTGALLLLRVDVVRGEADARATENHLAP